MPNWRDALKSNVELDEETCRLKANGQWLTDDNGITPYGRQYFAAELKALNVAIESAVEEIEYLRTFVPNERIDQTTLELMQEKARRDHVTLLEFKADAEQYMTRRMATDDVNS